jgi:hypothetical protein
MRLNIFYITQAKEMALTGDLEGSRQGQGEYKKLTSNPVGLYESFASIARRTPTRNTDEAAVDEWALTGTGRTASSDGESERLMIAVLT